MEWTQGPIKALGIYFGYDIKSKHHKNWDLKIQKLANTLNIWQRRQLTLPGRILIAKTLGISQMLYNASVLYTPDFYIKKVNSFFLILYGTRKEIG